MATSTKVSGKMIKLMAMVCLLIPTMRYMRETGKMTYNMATELRAGTMAQLSTQASSTKERRMEKEDLNGKMVASTRVTSLMDSSKVLVDITLQI